MIETNVLIVGGGGCGLVLACLLHDQKEDFLLVERNATTSDLPKAHYLNKRTMEILRQHDLDKEVFEQGTPPYNRSRNKFYTSFGGDGPLDRKTIYECSGLSGQGSSREKQYREASAADSANLPQIRLEPIFLQHARARASERIRFQHEFISLEQDEEGVTSTLRDLTDGSTYQVRSRYVVAADGGRTIGKQLGVKLEGEQNLITQMGVHFEADLSADYPDDRVLLNWIRSPKRPGVSVIVPMGPGQWGRHSPEWSLGFPRMPFDPEFDESNVIPLIRDILGLPNLAIKVRRVSQWTVGGVLADKYKIGRVFLAGDAAHRHPPTTGLGLSTGIQDAHNLAWKLASVLQGRAAPSLLESYEAERRPVGAFNVEWALNAFFNHVMLDMLPVVTHPGDLSKMQTPEHVQSALLALFADTPNGRMRRERLRRVYDTQHIEFSALDVELGFVYPQGAFTPDGTEPPPRDPMGQDYQPAARPGHRLPHAWMDFQNQTVSTHDFVGSCGGFALITGPRGQSLAAAAKAVASEMRVDLTIATVGSNGNVRDTEARWADLSKLSEDGAVLVRPDNIVGWRIRAGSTKDIESEFTAALRSCLS